MNTPLIKFLPMVMLASSSVVQAQSSTDFTPIFNSTYILQVIASFLMVMVALLGALWLLKRFNGGIRHRPSTLHVVASVGLGGREKAVLVQAGQRQLLLGVASGNVNLLHAFDEAVVESEKTEGLSFASALRTASGRRED